MLTPFSAVCRVAAFSKKLHLSLANLTPVSSFGFLQRARGGQRRNVVVSFPHILQVLFGQLNSREGCSKRICPSDRTVAPVREVGWKPESLWCQLSAVARTAFGVFNISRQEVFVLEYTDRICIHVSKSCLRSTLNFQLVNQEKVARF